MSICLRRRDFIAGLGGAAAWPLAAQAQQSEMPLIGFLHSGPPGPNQGSVAAFRRGLADAGFIENKNVRIEYRWAFNQFAGLPYLTADLIAHRPSVIVAGGSLGPALVAKRATSTIPIVFIHGGDPVKYGLVQSLNRPGGNITGMSLLGPELAGKRLGLLRELVPRANTVAFLAGTPNDITYEEQTSLILEAGHALGLEVVVVESRDDRDFEQAFETIVVRRIGALILGNFPLGNLNRVVTLAARHSIPTMYPARVFVMNGGLISYGPEGRTTYNQVATQYVARILKGAKPADLPVQQSTKFELIINLMTAKALGLTVPPNLFALADELIE
jgi:putative ABC transport system substrate-binding protein